MSKILMPDINSWLIPPLINFLKLIKNEHNISLYDAIHEFVDFYAYKCAYLAYEDMDSLSLYPLLSFDSDKRYAKIEKIFFLSEKPYFIKTWDYQKTVKLNDKKNVPKSFESDFPGLQFFSSYNNIDYFVAKEMLLKYSFERNMVKKTLMITNDAEKYKYESLKLSVVTFDFNFLNDCHFFRVKRYEFFKQLLPPNLLIELPIDLNIKIKEIPSKLKEEQMINLSKLKT